MVYKKSSETKWTSRDKQKFMGVWVEKTTMDMFNRLYPRLFPLYVRRCLLRAVQDKSFMDDVFFNTVDDYDDLGKNNPNFHATRVK